VAVTPVAPPRGGGDKGAPAGVVPAAAHAARAVPAAGDAWHITGLTPQNLLATALV
jgi:hypothetical protein